MTQKSLAGKCALITGAAHRIGAEIARTLHCAGMDVVLHYRSSEKAAITLRDELEQQRAGSVQLVRADLNEAGSAARIVEEAVAFKGRLDLLVNNASGFYPTPLDRTTPAQWDDLIGTNLKAPFLLAQAAAPWLQQVQGNIVNLLDIHAERPLADHAIYCMAKAGNAMMVKSLALELGPAIRVNGISPGAILWPEGAEASQKEAILARTALKRPGLPKEIADTLLFLVLGGTYITGQIITVDGGRTLQQ